MARTTVVIPNYQGIKYIEDCLSSLYQGTVIPDVILVDNNSEDGSLPLVKEKFPKVQVIEFTTNTGFCKAVNEGIRVAETEFVLLLNNDTVVHQDMVKELEASLDKYPKAFSCGAKMICLHEKNKLDGAGDFYCALGWGFARGKGKPAEAFDRPARVFSACAGAAIYRREIFEKIGYFDENHYAYLEDIDIGYRANIYGYHNRYQPQAKVFHAGSAASGSKYNVFKVKQSARNNVYLIYKNMPFLQILVNLPFLAAGFLIKYLFFLKKGMGGDYCRAFKEGFALCKTRQGKKNKVKFSPKNLKNYFWIQIQLWFNMVRRICDF